MRPPAMLPSTGVRMSADGFASTSTFSAMPQVSPCRAATLEVGIENDPLCFTPAPTAVPIWNTTRNAPATASGAVARVLNQRRREVVPVWAGVSGLKGSRKWNQNATSSAAAHRYSRTLPRATPKRTGSAPHGMPQLE
jgi:hypothetical protein